jgi:hypothetical protein
MEQLAEVLVMEQLAEIPEGRLEEVLLSVRQGAKRQLEEVRRGSKRQLTKLQMTEILMADIRGKEKWSTKVQD